MIKIKQLTVHPNLGNDVRYEVIEWCNKQWGDYHLFEGDEWTWFTTSNYDRGAESGTFDVIFKDVKAANLFLLRWGGQVFDVEYEECFVPDPEVLDKLFI
jgi:hypothetical protein